MRWLLATADLQYFSSDLGGLFNLAITTSTDVFNWEFDGPQAYSGTTAPFTLLTGKFPMFTDIANGCPAMHTSIEYVVNNCLRPLMHAKETKFFANNGIVLDTKEVEALDIRIRAIEVWARLMGAYTAQKVQLSGDLSLDFNHVSDDDLDRTIAGLLESPQSTPKN